MYNIYIGKKLIVLTSVLEKVRPKRLLFLQKASAAEIIKKISKKKYQKIWLFHPKEEELLPIFAQRFPFVQACGGLVGNAKGQKLFIKRNGYWDLPKGKLEKNEQLERCALREVEEETGIKGLLLQEKLLVTYHLFERKCVFYCKQTHWYNMFSDFEGNFTPQKEEGIEKVRWKSLQKVQKILHKTYGNIADVIKASSHQSPTFL